MKINELTGYKKNPIYQKAQSTFMPVSSNADDVTSIMQSAVARGRELITFRSFLELHGFKHMGTGLYGSVYSNPLYPYVFKIFKNDPTYKTFIEYCIKNQNNPNIPKIKGKLLKINNETFAVRLEKLENINKMKFSDLIHIFDTLYWANKLSALDTKQTMRLQTKYPGIWTILNWIDVHGNFDLHLSNIMQRSDGTPVLTDPISLNKQKQIKEDKNFKGSIIAKHWGGYNGRKIPEHLKSFIQKHIKRTSNGNYYIPQYNDSWYLQVFQDQNNIHDFKSFIKLLSPYFSVHRIQNLK